MTPKTILLTGSSGFVASELKTKIEKIAKVIAVDLVDGPNTSIVCDIASDYFSTFCRDKAEAFGAVTVVHMAAARFDFGIEADRYFESNVQTQTGFLSALDNLNVTKFIHVSSVAAIDGETMNYSSAMSCDDAYRSTKYLQEQIVVNWCKNNSVDLIALYPSAIFSHQKRMDTNIGKLIRLVRYMPFVPAIPVSKSLTYLPSFCDYITLATQNKVPAGRYLTIENPILNVSQMIQLLSGKKLMLVRIPLFKQLLTVISHLLYVFGGFGKIDTKLTPNRVKKLFSDTSYSNTQSIDRQHYASNSKSLIKILENLSKDNS